MDENKNEAPSSEKPTKSKVTITPKPKKSMSPGEWAITGCLTLGFAALYVCILALLDGWALTWVWHWFVVPLFGLAGLSISEAIGLGLVVGVFDAPKNYTTNDDPRAAFKHLGFRLAHPIVILFLGWLLHLAQG